MDRTSTGRKAKKERPEGKKKGQIGGSRTDSFQPELLYAAGGLIGLLLLIALWGVISTGRFLPHFEPRQSE